MSLSDLINDIATVLTTPAFTPSARDSSGAPVRTYSVTKFSGVPVRIQDGPAKDDYGYAQREMNITHTVFTEQNGIAPKDLLVTSDSRNFVVNGVSKRHAIGSFDAFYVLDCTEVRPGA